MPPWLRSPATSRAICRGAAFPAEGREAWAKEARPVLKDVTRFSPLAVTKATLMEEQSWKDGRRRTWDLQLGPEWAVPCVEYVPASPGAPIALVVADGGRAACVEKVAELWAAGHHVFALDVHLVGELVLRGQVACLWALMVATAGERSLGIQAAQLQAVATWAEADAIYAYGATMTVATTIAAALETNSRPSRLELHGLPATLKLLLEMERGFDVHPALYCFGLLREFDVGELLALCEGREVVSEEVWGEV